jgi:hypothetical protein
MNFGHYNNLRLPKKACPDNDFLLRRSGRFQNPAIFTFQSLFQVMFTSYFGLTFALSGPFLPVYPTAGDA